MTGEEAIRELQYVRHFLDGDSNIAKAFDMAIEVLREERIGHWKIAGLELYKCTECGSIVSTSNNPYTAFKYCSECGCRMEGGKVEPITLYNA